MILIYKWKYGKYTAEKDINGFYSVYKNTKNIFGNGYTKEKILDSLTYSQVMQAKKEISAVL